MQDDLTSDEFDGMPAWAQTVLKNDKRADRRLLSLMREDGALVRVYSGKPPTYTEAEVELLRQDEADEAAGMQMLASLIAFTLFVCVLGLLFFLVGVL